MTGERRKIIKSYAKIFATCRKQRRSVEFRRIVQQSIIFRACIRTVDRIFERNASTSNFQWALKLDDFAGRRQNTVPRAHSLSHPFSLSLSLSVSLFLFRSLVRYVVRHVYAIYALLVVRARTHRMRKKFHCEIPRISLLGTRRRAERTRTFLVVV